MLIKLRGPYSQQGDPLTLLGMGFLERVVLGGSVFHPLMKFDRYSVS